MAKRLFWSISEERFADPRGQALLSMQVAGDLLSGVALGGSGSQSSSRSHREQSLRLYAVAESSHTPPLLSIDPTSNETFCRRRMLDCEPRIEKVQLTPPALA